MLQRAGFREITISKSLDTKDLQGTSQEFRYKYGTLIITALK